MSQSTPHHNKNAQKSQKLAAELNENPGDAATDEPNIPNQRLDQRPFSRGHKVENQLPDDDQDTEKLVQQGVNDAERDEMLAASRTSTKSEG